MLVSMAATGKQIARHHTTHPGWRVLVARLSQHADKSDFSAEQAVSILAAAGLLAAGPATGLMSQQTCTILADAVCEGQRTFSGSVCVGVLHGLTVLQASAEAWYIAAHGMLGAWLLALQDEDLSNARALPAECLAVVEACAKYKADPGQQTLNKAATLAFDILDQIEVPTSQVWLAAASHGMLMCMCLHISRAY